MAEVDVTPRCETCRFFLPGKRGYCRRFPPLTGIVATEPAGRYPQVLPKDWCGEYAEKEKES